MKTILFFKVDFDYLSANSVQVQLEIAPLANDGTWYLYKISSNIYNTAELKKFIKGHSKCVNGTYLTISEAYTFGDANYVQTIIETPKIVGYDEDGLEITDGVTTSYGPTFKELMNVSLQDLKDQYAQDLSDLGEAKANSIVSYDMKTPNDTAFLKTYFTNRVNIILQHLENLKIMGLRDSITLEQYKEIKKRAVSEWSNKLSIDGIDFTDGHNYDMLSSDQNDWNSLIIRITNGNIIISEETPFTILDSSGIPRKFTSADDIKACFNIGFLKKNEIKAHDTIKKIAITMCSTMDEVDNVDIFETG